MQATADGILTSGMIHYKRKLQAELDGGPRLNDRRDDLTVQRRRAKLGDSVEVVYPEERRREGNRKEG